MTKIYFFVVFLKKNLHILRIRFKFAHIFLVITMNVTDKICARDMREWLNSSPKGITPSADNTTVNPAASLSTPIKSESHYLSLLFFENPIGINNICHPAFLRGINTLKFPLYV